MKSGHFLTGKAHQDKTASITNPSLNEVHFVFRITDTQNSLRWVDGFVFFVSRTPSCKSHQDSTIEWLKNIKKMLDTGFDFQK